MRRKPCKERNQGVTGCSVSTADELKYWGINSCSIFLFRHFHKLRILHKGAFSTKFLQNIFSIYIDKSAPHDRIYRVTLYHV